MYKTCSPVMNLLRVRTAGASFEVVTFYFVERNVLERVVIPDTGFIYQLKNSL